MHADSAGGRSACLPVFVQRLKLIQIYSPGVYVKAQSTRWQSGSFHKKQGEYIKKRSFTRKTEGNVGRQDKSGVSELSDAHNADDAIQMFNAAHDFREMGAIFDLNGEVDMRHVVGVTILHIHITDICF